MLSVLWAIKSGLIEKELGEIVYETIFETERNKHGVVTKSKAIDWVTDTVDAWLEEADEWDTLIVDSATALNEFVMIRALENMDSLGYSQSWKDTKKVGMQVRRIQDYGGGMTLFEQFVEWIRSLDKNIVFICHEYQEETESGIVKQRLPLLIGQLRQRVVKMFDEVWWMHVEGTGKKTRYMVQTRSDSKVVAKTRMGFLEPDEEWLSYPKLAEKIEKAWGVTV